ncbi:hypothetical protein JX265_006067 [Neoarthrinium moseri]|uniref:Zn(2)-C6 fungal-type domain-containing protein n=1 Tax=Neoarthrinium moseri TaxID=1658444 RepID=A0A9P9WMX8_9PEZI|nr:uncharacterized protein JN550_004284 [Neoarthrinium moseri]KAI1855664.1 hypothetical protein JX266_000529 [Neoarthrinium moseri]KAI1871027.1 hypothetical protein JX265_006067 [Neoarthrinium moseri]KAI1872081.1 hypothetical protein JN550_004284 [Neoarthrinium moseri]
MSSSVNIEHTQGEPKAAKPTGKVRKRAPKACLSCRARKVRCDVSQRGRPCMNCYLDSETCVVTGRASRLRAERNGDNSQASYPPYNAENDDHSRSAEDIVRSRLNGESTSPTANNDEGIHQENPHDTCDSHHHEELPQPEMRDEPSMPPPAQPVPNVGNIQNTYNKHPVPPATIKGSVIFVPTEESELTDVDFNPTGVPEIPPYMSTDTPLWVGDQRVAVNADITYSYYPFLSVNNLHNIMPQDVNYLESQGCFRVPTREILDEFVQQYFLHIHPMLPMLNEGDFWDIYGHCGHGGSGDKMPLLVFYSMIFSSCNFVSKSSIKALGFPSIRAARATLYRRCKLLYDFDSEFSMVYLAQSALLLSHWSPNFTHAFKKANSMWLGMAIQNAKSAEAHHYSAMPTYSASVDPIQSKKQNVLKRLWWCCILRDRILPLGLRRSLKITRSHFDFDANTGLGYTDLADEIDRSRVYNSGTKRCLIEIFVQVIELCTVLTDLIMLVFPLDDSPGWGKQFGFEETEKIRECKTALRRWYKGATLRFPMFGGDAVPRMTVTGGKEFQHDSVILYTNLMYMYYHSARVALSHHEVLQTAVAAASPNLTSNLREFSNIFENRHELQDAASGVTECLKELVQLKLARWLPISAVASTALPLVLHIIDVKLSTYNKNNTSVISRPQDAVKQHRLNILIEAMKTYQPQYDGVDYVSETIRHIVTLAQLDTPAPPSSTSNNITDWQDILSSQPGCYLRLAMTMDLSLSKGRLPEESDFPASLRGLFTAGYSSVKALMGAGKTNIAPMPQYQMYSNTADQIMLPMGVMQVPGTVHSLSSDTDSDSPGSQDDHAMGNYSMHNGPAAQQQQQQQQQKQQQNTGQQQQQQQTQPDHNNDLHFGSHNFVDSALEMGGLAGEALAAYSIQNDSPQSSGSDLDGDGTLFDGEETIMTDWIGNAWGNDERGDQETARVLLDALRESEGMSIECGA